VPAVPAQRLPAPPRPLVVTDDPVVREELLRIAATTGTELDVAPEAGAARRRWAAAGLVVVAADAAEGCARLRLPRRSGVVLLGVDLHDAGVWQRAVEVGAERVLFLPDCEPWLSTAFADAVEGSGPDGLVVAVLGGRGGAGATTLASALAVTATRTGRSVLLVDGDPLGGGIDLVFGGEADRGLRWPDLDDTRGRVPAAALAEALPRMDGLSVLSWDRGSATPVPAEAMAAVLAAGRRAHDLVVVDLPRAVDDAGRVVLAAAGCVLLVVPAEVRAAAAAGRVAGSVGLLCRDLRVVVRGPSPSGLDGTAVARALGLPLVGQLRPEPGLELALERGEAPGHRGRGPLAELCGRLLEDLLPAQRRAA
jgi:secretion/DNA translocation related CpaE-like protein